MIGMYKFKIKKSYHLQLTIILKFYIKKKMYCLVYK